MRRYSAAGSLDCSSDHTEAGALTGRDRCSYLFGEEKNPILSLHKASQDLEGM